MRWDGGEIAIEHDEVGHPAGSERSFVGLAEFCVSRALGVRVERLRNRQLLFRKVALGAGFVFARDSSIDAAEGSDWLDGIVGAEGQRHAMIEEALPRVGVAGTIMAEALLRPGHIGEQMVGLHGGDHAKLFVAIKVLRHSDTTILFEYLRVLDTRSLRCECGHRETIAYPARIGSIRKGDQGHFHRAVADCMKSNLEPGLGAFECHRIQLLLVITRDASVASFVRVRRVKRRGA